ncbi:SAM-dependent methyltransferase [Marinicella sp. S1101]|uniref:SAM-dependent methyltransferase n=1 Tax=Marinicella marina TaxID=2996016 RepID=UPI002260B507|nr:SAM-dependent methyltransferase [Marinicella marina]MCX7553809.1 SAM-dependent methyltransferase [Marinicella marina]MDJ1140885.1 SAM-dependent methyltransferase [Marinicella marina]
MKKGKLVNVGLGMTLGAHITPISRNFIEQADVVFVSASNQLVEEWVKTMNDHVISLQPYYQEGQSRMVTYRNMVAAIMAQVRAGKSVCGAYYGHPGVFAWPPHETIRMCRDEGYQAHMEPGVSAEACLYADLGIDPGQHGCAHFEASQFLFNHRPFDPSAYLILWQIAMAGDKAMKTFETTPEQRQLLVDLLLKTYPKNHQVTLYECPVLPIEQAMIKTVSLQDLAHQEVSLKSTLVVPPAIAKQTNQAMIDMANSLSQANDHITD